MKNKYNQSCPHWVSQYLFNAKTKVNFNKEPYDRDTLDYLDVLFNYNLIQKIEKLIKIEYSDPDVQKALYNFIISAWNEKIRQGQN